MAGDLVFRVMLRMEINKRATTTWPLAVQLITCHASIDYSHNIDIPQRRIDVMNHKKESRPLRS